MQVEPHQASRRKYDPRAEHECDGLHYKAEQHCTAKDEPTQRLPTKEDEQAL